MAAPFEKFKVDNPILSGWNKFIVEVWPMPALGHWIPSENQSRHQQAKKFIEDAIREKLERERARG